ncbi:hypothetical protein GGR57DRAFT_107648 [Xylariaceae sp. FL1272]|nr:hypothetical protein GGR57DRAFT_107648 [Xylariaceae sp. FL1272]
MHSIILSLAALLGVATALPAPQTTEPTEIWAVNNFTIFSSKRMGEARISFLTDASSVASDTDRYSCSAKVASEADGGIPQILRSPCDAKGTTFSFNPYTDDPDSVSSLQIYTTGATEKQGVAVFVRDALILQNGTERWVGSPNFGISNIFG